MPRQESVGTIRRPPDSGSEDKVRTKFIHFVDGQQPKIHEVWNFGEDGVTPKVHLTARVYVCTFVGEYFANNDLTLTWHMSPFFGRKSINGSVEWLGIRDFLRNDGPPWTLNLPAPSVNWGDRGSSTSLNLCSGSGGYSESVSINCN